MAHGVADTARRQRGRKAQETSADTAAFEEGHSAVEGKSLHFPPGLTWVKKINYFGGGGVRMWGKLIFKCLKN